MNMKATLAIVSAIVSIASVTTTAAAAGTTSETHAYLEAERTRTDGQVEPISIGRMQAGFAALAVAEPTHMDAWFEIERSRTDGGTDLALDADGTSRHAVKPIAGVFHGRVN